MTGHRSHMLWPWLWREWLRCASPLWRSVCSSVRPLTGPAGASASVWGWGCVWSICDRENIISSSFPPTWIEIKLISTLKHLQNQHYYLMLCFCLPAFSSPLHVSSSHVLLYFHTHCCKNWNVLAVCPRSISAFTQGGRNLNFLTPKKVFWTDIHVLRDYGWNLKWLS